MRGKPECHPSTPRRVLAGKDKMCTTLPRPIERRAVSVSSAAQGSGKRVVSLPGPKRSGSLSSRKPRQMDTNPVGYWNAQAKDYDDNIFSTIDEDKTGIIRRTLDRFAQATPARTELHCVDLGCGAGKYLPALAARFHKVVAYDLSPKLVALARQELAKQGIMNAEAHVRDLSQVWYREGAGLGDSHELGRYDFAVMANVMIAPVLENERLQMLRNAHRSLNDDGRLLVIVPAVESALFVNMRCSEVPYRGIDTSDVLQQPTKSESVDILKGIFKRSGVRTKHYLEVEFSLLARRAGFDLETSDRIEFTWAAELGLESDREVPAALQGPPFPWDWLFVLAKISDNKSEEKQGRMVSPDVKPERDALGHLPRMPRSESRDSQRLTSGPPL